MYPELQVRHQIREYILITFHTSSKHLLHIFYNLPLDLTRPGPANAAHLPTTTIYGSTMESWNLMQDILQPENRHQPASMHCPFTQLGEGECPRPTSNLMLFRLPCFDTVLTVVTCKSPQDCSSTDSRAHGTETLQRLEPWYRDVYSVDKFTSERIYFC